jgi:hypothetical protein
LIIDREGELLLKTGFRRTPLGVHCTGFADAADHARPR